MYAETELMFPYSLNFSQQVHQFDDFCSSHKPYVSLGIPSSPDQTYYNLGGEGDLFMAPEAVMGEPLMGLDPMAAAAISMMSCGEDVISPQSLTMSDIESSIECGQLLYECRKDLLAKEGNETQLCEVLDIKTPNVNFIIDEKLLADGAFQTSINSNCLRSMDSVPEAALKPRFPALDFEAYNGMRRAFSEGDIKSLGKPSEEQPFSTGSCTPDVRREKLSRYWSKKAKRNFGRKIKYACRKALADSQPRIRGRFAKTEEIQSSKMQ